MSTAFELLTPKIGNHPLGCPCVTCTAAVAKLKATPYVKLLESELIAAIKANAQGSPAVVSSLEAQVLSLRDQLTRSQDGERTLTNTLAESRKIAQEREAQLAKRSSESTRWARKAEALAQEKLELADALANEKRTHRDLQLAVGEIREFLRVPEEDTLLEAVEDLYSRCQSWGDKAARMGEANTKLQTDLKAANDQHDRTADDLDAALAEVKKQSERAEFYGAQLSGAKFAVQEAADRAAVAEKANTELYEALQEERRASHGGMVIALTVGMIFSAVIAFLVGRYGR